MNISYSVAAAIRLTTNEKKNSKKRISAQVYPCLDILMKLLKCNNDSLYKMKKYSMLINLVRSSSFHSL
ncbi:hypothetical protein RclHR1_06090005 [Rhizophagus clarus]|uniref:Uncharacterized protein n=1 Tax=Rhizophagus clarus TaxID=94130 RepID=A0A2Z6SHE9_9GLOM|nr:hypothetical protein RclHR1_06090005 [Rhizophagus clarus]GES81506.1 hypothetical protein RCL_jg4715.t1 [Rhizophagus clarus]